MKQFKKALQAIAVSLVILTPAITNAQEYTPTPENLQSR